MDGGDIVRVRGRVYTERRHWTAWVPVKQGRIVSLELSAGSNHRTVDRDVTGQKGSRSDPSKSGHCSQK